MPTSFLSKTKLNPSSFQPYVTGSVGVERIAPATGPSQQHIAFLIGGGLNYKATDGMWVNLFEARYAKLPGLANNTASASRYAANEYSVVIQPEPTDVLSLRT